MGPGCGVHHENKVTGNRILHRCPQDQCDDYTSQIGHHSHGTPRIKHCTTTLERTDQGPQRRRTPVGLHATSGRGRGARMSKREHMLHYSSMQLVSREEGRKDVFQRKANKDDMGAEQRIYSSCRRKHKEEHCYNKHPKQ